MERKPRIAIMAPTPPPVMGPSIATMVILNSEVLRRYNVIFIDTADRRDLNKLGALDLRNISLALIHYWKLSYIIIRRSPKLVYLLVSQTNIGFLRDLGFIIINLLLRRKQILHLRGGHFPEFYNRNNFVMKKIVKFFLNRIDLLIVLCERVKWQMTSILPEEKIFVVPNGRDLRFPRPIPNEKRQFQILYLGSLIPSKGFFEILEAIPAVVSRSPQTKFVFGGGWRRGDDRMTTERYIEEHRLESNVQFLGIITGRKKEMVLANADLLVFPTYYKFEGHPWVLVEAAAAGLPIISTDHACIPDIVVDGKNGYLVPKKNSEAIADRIIELIGDPEKRKSMSEYSLKLYQERFTERCFIRKLCEAFEKVLS